MIPRLGQAVFVLFVFRDLLESKERRYVWGERGGVYRVEVRVTEPAWRPLEVMGVVARLLHGVGHGAWGSR